MANLPVNFLKKLFVIISLVCIFGIAKTFARKTSPLLVEDDGYRRSNRPAGKFLHFSIKPHFLFIKPHFDRKTPLKTRINDI